MEKNELGKKEKRTKTPQLVDRVKDKEPRKKKTTRGKITGRPKPKAPSRWRQQFVVQVLIV